MRSKPTLQELREQAQKPRHREIGNWLAIHWGRPTAIYGTWAAVRYGVSAHQVTLLAILATLTGASGLGWGSWTGFGVGVAFLHLAFWLDHVDGQVARWTKTASLDGVYLDFFMHHLWALTVGFGLGMGLQQITKEPLWSLAGFLVGLGWLALSLHNDCKYKAMFAQLAQETQTRIVKGGGGSRPEPPTPWPKSGTGFWTWPALKACEPHSVLVSLAALAVLSWLSPSAGLWAWKTFVLSMAVLAPTLALGRSLRSIRSGKIEQEFARWFH